MVRGNATPGEQIKLTLDLSRRFAAAISVRNRVLPQSVAIAG
jgi:hypothetical protein